MARRILLLITDLEIGGTPTVVRELALRLRGDEFEVEVACLAGWGPVADELRAAGVHVEALAARGARDLLRTVRRLRELVRQRNYDTVFSFLIHANVAAAIASRKLPQVRFIQSIQTTQRWPRWHWWIQGLLQYRARKIVVPSPSVATTARRRSLISHRKLLVIPNAIDVARFDPGRRDWPAEISEQRPLRIGFIGRLDPVKRVDNLIRAMAELGERFHLHVYGEGGERARLERIVVRMQLQRRVTFHGPTRQPDEALRQIDVLVLPSYFEGFGLVLIEAMAARVPIVAANVPGIRDVVRHDQTALMVPSGQPRYLSAAIRDLWERKLRDRLVENGAREVRQRYSWDVVLPQYRALLNEVSRD